MDLTTYANNVVQAATQNSQQVGQTLMQEGTAVAKALTPFVVTAELTFVGLRIVFRQFIVEQLTRFTIHFMILFIIVYMQFPQSLILSVKDQLSTAGQQLGFSLASTSSSQPAISGSSSMEPSGYWSYWLGDISNDQDVNNKLGIASMRARFDPNATLITITETPATGNTAVDYWNKLKQAFASAVNYINKSFEAVINALIAVVTLIFNSGYIMLSLASQFTCLMAPALTQISVLCTSQYALYFALGVGVSVVPLMFFTHFKNIWRNYLVFVTGLALIPPFYYILSGMGFALATTMFEAMFPLNDYTNGFGQIINSFLDMFFRRVANILLLGLGPSWVGDIFSNIMVGCINFSKDFGFFLSSQRTDKTSLLIL